MSSDLTVTHKDSIPKDIPLTDIKLPNEWVLYLYDKQLFKKIANRANFQAKPHRALCTITTVNDLIYILKLMSCENTNKSKVLTGNEKKINLDVNDYIIMRKGIEPIWEDPRNSNGGTFTVKMNHLKGYEVWSLFVMYILGETLNEYDMDNINGITVSYISDAYNFNATAKQNINSFTYIKIWDGKSNRTRDEFINILPVEILDKIKHESIMYSQNNKKKILMNKILLVN
ncbi:Translation initiation factor 4E [Acanthamoeba polyphaga moumouvirus]|uniref:Translation initiation factor 4E n=3 Tax=Moumouvirus TaxID=3080801 RepID=L7RBI1_9VIRU|nr:Translation initiation factor 4E [Acanthamoeba polyphaga moumouvirus]AGC01849.1 Translation initiation factor 4E [Acanthamoeba polyphaga moumouvirus]